MCVVIQTRQEGQQKRGNDEGGLQPTQWFVENMEQPASSEVHDDKRHHGQLDIYLKPGLWVHWVLELGAGLLQVPLCRLLL